MLIVKKDDNTLKNFGPYENKKFTLQKQNIEWDYKDLGKQNMRFWKVCKR